MIPTPATVMAEHAHEWQVDGSLILPACSCGWKASKLVDELYEANLAHAAHQLAVLAEEGWAIVKIPAPDMSDDKFGQVWSNDPVVGTVQARLDGTCELRGDYEYTHTAAELREAAAILLAAARAAEGVDQ